MTALATPPKLQFLDANGAPLVGGKLYTYAAGTTTPQVSYTDFGGGTANANPVILNSRGEASVWLGTALYKMALYSATDVLIWTVDNIGGFATLAQLAASGGSALVGYLPAGTGAVATTVQSKLRESVSVLDFGADPTGSTSSTSAIQNALTYLASFGGGTLYFPAGSYKTTAQIDVPSANITLLGNGRRKCYPGLFVPSANTLSTIFGVHTGRNLFRFSSETLDVLSNFHAENINFATLEAGSIPTAAFGFECGNFQRDFTFERCGIHGFTSAFDVYTVSAIDTAMGVFKAINCSINRNSWIARNLNSTQWNGFIFEKNEAGQNGFGVGTGGIDIRAHACAIRDNLLEGQRDPIKVTGTFSPVFIVNNYFEQTVGFANIYVNQCKGPVNILSNFYSNSTNLVTHRVFVEKSAFVKTDGPYWPSGAYRSSLPKFSTPDTSSNGLGNVASLYSSTTKFTRVDDVQDVSAQGQGAFLSSTNTNVTGRREINPLSGNPMPCTAFTAGGTAATNRVTSSRPVTAAVGNWIVASVMVKFDSTIATPYLSWSGLSDGTQDFSFDNFPTAGIIGNWYVITVAYRTTAIVSGTVSVLFYPYGVSSAAGPTAAVSGLTFSVVDSIEKVIPFVWSARIELINAIPTTGTWVTADKLWSSVPGASTTPGWVCIAGGTPGTWKDMAILGP
jgi:hypothetical protein